MLLIDTSRSRPTIFLSYGESLIGASPDSDSFLLPRIADLLQQHSLSLSDLSALAVGSGPGRFAATRSGVALFASIALAARLPLLSFPSPLLYLPPLTGPFLFVTGHKSGPLTALKGKIEEGVIVEYLPLRSIAKEELSEEALAGIPLLSDTPDLLPRSSTPLSPPNPSPLFPFLWKKLSSGQACPGTPEVHYGFDPS